MRINLMHILMLVALAAAGVWLYRRYYKKN